MHRPQLIFALVLMLALPLQSLASLSMPDCAPQAAASQAHAGHDMPMPDADPAHDCCDQPESSCPTPNACSAASSAAVPVARVADAFHGLAGVYAAALPSSPQSAHRTPLIRPPIAS